MIPIRTRNRANNSQGVSRHAVLKQAQERRAARAVVRLCLAPRSAPTLPCVVVLHRVGTTTRLDTDGLAQALKAVRDEVAAWLGLPTNKRGQADDADPRVTWLYSQETAGKGHSVKIGVWSNG